MEKELDKKHEPVLAVGEVQLICNGEHCSKGPHKFSDCVVSQMPPESVNIQEIRMKCTSAISHATLPNNHIRNLLYFWYATTIFSFTHKGTRRPLPRCLVAAIRALYPNPAGMPYAGFQSEGGQFGYAYNIGEGEVDQTPGLTDVEEEERVAANAVVNAAAHASDAYAFAGFGAT